MGWPLLLGFIALPVIEIALFIKTSQWVGILATVLLAIGAGALGLIVLRRQGFVTLMRMQSVIQAGRPPVQEVFDGLCLAVAGLLLILPGFFTDFLALLLLLPPVRAVLLVALAAKLTVSCSVTPDPPGSSGPSGSGPTILDGDYTVIHPDNPPKGPKALL